MTDWITHPMTRFPVKQGEYLLEQIETAREKLAKCEQAYQDYLTPVAIETQKVDSEFKAKLDYWFKHGAPGFIRDETDGFKSMADGKTYTSKAKYRADIRARGYEEIGDEREAFDKIGEVDHEVYDRQLEKDIYKTIGEMGL